MTIQEEFEKQRQEILADAMSRVQWVDPDTNQIYWLTAEELVERGKNGG